MIQLNTLKPAAGSRTKAVRIGRGRGNGKGGTSGKGNNGDKCRSGHRSKPYFEGGQTPLTRRIPKRGFNSPFRKEFQIVNIGRLQAVNFTEKEIDAAVLLSHGLIHSAEKPVKILGKGELTKTISLKVDAYSKSVRDQLKLPKVKSR